MGAMRRKAATCQKAKGKTPGFKPVSCEIVIASAFKDWQVPLCVSAPLLAGLLSVAVGCVQRCTPQIIAIDVIRELNVGYCSSLPQHWKKRILQDERVKPRAKEM